MTSVDGTTRITGLPANLIAESVTLQSIVFGSEERLSTIKSSQPASALAKAIQANPPQAQIDVYWDVAADRKFITELIESEVRNDVPPNFHFLFELPELINFVRLHFNLMSDENGQIVVTAKDEASAKRIVEIYDALLTTGQLAMKAEMANNLDLNDPTQAAFASYLNRISGLAQSSIQPKQNGSELSWSFPANAQVAGVMVGLLLPAVQQAGSARTSSRGCKQSETSWVGYSQLPRCERPFARWYSRCTGPSAIELAS
ncbi:MAG: hypothetical protein R3C03_07305 [Pirellulaceae bacterium]